MPNTNSLIVYEGPSTIDGAPIVVILTGLDQSSANEKTGNLVQSFIIRADAEPHDALKTGDDASVCGLCPHRPLIVRMLAKVGVVSSPCYVRVSESVLSVFRAYRRGSYARASSIAQVGAVLAGRKLRLGTYGDPAAAPVGLWALLVSLASGHVGYTHQWQSVGFDARAWAPLVMASADSAAEAAQATAMGMRYFRVSIGVDKQPLEVTCPASVEGGRKAQCSDCMLCGGTSKNARSIVIADHASGHESRARVIPIVPMTCAHSDFPVLRVKRTDRSVWFTKHSMITITTDYKRQSITESFPTMEQALAVYADADYAACHQPGNDIRRITLRIDGATVKYRSY